jgi:heme/copper-type cytochrome/quinol oxidase subunit 3
VSKQFVDFFCYALTYRSRQEAVAGPADLETSEAAIIAAFLLVTLRYATRAAVKLTKQSNKALVYLLFSTAYLHSFYANPDQ